MVGEKAIRAEVGTEREGWRPYTSYSLGPQGILVALPGDGVEGHVAPTGQIYSQSVQIRV